MNKMIALLLNCYHNLISVNQICGNLFSQPYLVKAEGLRMGHTHHGGTCSSHAPSVLQVHFTLHYYLQMYNGPSRKQESTLPSALLWRVS